MGDARVDRAGPFGFEQAIFRASIELVWYCRSLELALITRVS
jgi:hypothetical protein